MKRDQHWLRGNAKETTLEVLKKKDKVMGGNDSTNRKPTVGVDRTHGWQMDRENPTSSKLEQSTQSKSGKERHTALL